MDTVKVDTAEERDAKRSAIESEFHGQREELYKQYSEDRRLLEQTYREDLGKNARARWDALTDAGLNPNGSDPRERPRG